MELVRRIVLAVQTDEIQYPHQVDIAGYDRAVVAKHCALIIEAGLARGTLLETDAHGVVSAIIERLTNEGHDFAEAIQNDTIWNKAKEHVIKPGVAFGFSLFVEWVREQARRQFPGHS